MTWRERFALIMALLMGTVEVVTELDPETCRRLLAMDLTLSAQGGPGAAKWTVDKMPLVFVPVFLPSRCPDPAPPVALLPVSVFDPETNAARRVTVLRWY